MNKYVLKLMGLSEVQWEWKKRAWKRRGVKPWERLDHPVLSAILISIGLVYMMTIVANGGNPFASFGGQALSRTGFVMPGLVRDYGEWWRLVTAVFVHFNLLHILFNGMALYQVGPYVEEEYGGARLFVVFVVTGFVGNFLELLFMPSMGALGGASGGVFGLIGFCGLHAHLNRNYVVRSIMFRWAMYSFVFGIFAGAANFAHFGGFAAGMGLALILPVYRFSASSENGVFKMGAIALLFLTLFTWGKALANWRGQVAWEACYRAMQVGAVDQALEECEEADQLLGYPETQKNLEILREGVR